MDTLPVSVTAIITQCGHRVNLFSDLLLSPWLERDLQETRNVVCLVHLCPMSQHIEQALNEYLQNDCLA